MTSTVLAQCRVPLVLDADALNIIADQPELLEQAKTDIILTPHPGEMSRLTKKPVSENSDHTGAICRNLCEAFPCDLCIKRFSYGYCRFGWHDVCKFIGK